MRPSDEASAPLTPDLAPVDLPAAAGGEGPRRSRTLRRWQGITLALLAGATVFGACQGDNLFNGNSESVQPKIVGIAIPGQVYPGDTIQVQVSAYGPRQITRIEVSLAGAAAGDTVVTLSTPQASVAQSVRIALPYFLRDTALVIRALAYDKVGAASRMRSDTASAVAIPVVLAIQGPDSIRGGQTSSFAVTAAGFSRISQLRFSFKGINLPDTLLSLQRPDTLVSAQMDLNIPAAALSDTIVTVLVSAIDTRNVSSGWYATRTPVVIAVPVIDSVTVADTVRAGSPLDVSVRAHGLRKVNRLNFSLRRGIVRDSVVNVTLPSTNISQSASFNVPGDVQDSVITLSVSALDAAGGMSAPVSKKVTIPVGIPVIDSLMTPDSIRPGTILDARVVAHGSRPLARIDLSLRGAVNQDVSINPTPLRVNVTQDFAVPLPDTVKDSLLVVMTKATDTGGNVSAIRQKTIRTSDTAPPTVVATLTQTSVAAGGRAPVRIQATDNVGLSRVGVRIYNSAKVQVAGDSASVTGRTRDSTFAVAIPISGPMTLSVVGYARDRSGNEARAAALSLMVIDSVVPMDSIRTPANGQTFPIGDSVLVTVRAASLVGIKKIDLSGVAFRGGGSTDVTVAQRFVPKSIVFPQAPLTIMPHDTVVSRWLLAVSDTISEPVSIISQVTDSLGNTATDTAYVNVGGPLVNIVTPVSGASLGLAQPFQLRVFARDKTAGVDSVKVYLTGAKTDSVKWSSLGVSDSITVQQNVTVATAGSLTLTPVAWNRRGIIGRGTPIVTNVSAGGSSDTQKPSVSLSVNAPVRAEFTDPIAVALHAQDNGSAGVVRMGIVAMVARPANFTGPQVDTVALATPVMTPRTGGVDTTFTFTPADFGLTDLNLVLPSTIAMQVYGFAVDAAGNCGTGISPALDSIACQQVTISTAPAGNFYVATGRTPATVNIVLVEGRSVVFPAGVKLVDVEPDLANNRVYASDIRNNVVQVVGTTTYALGNQIRVGSQPWGLGLNLAGDTLFVANSGGTNISMVSTASLKEDSVARIRTPNANLINVRISVTSAGTRYSGEILDFSDRPQFLAEDAQKRILFSTVPTPSAPDGTIRVATTQPGWLQPEVAFLAPSDAVVADTTTRALANIDSVTIVGGASSDQIILYEHVNGSPTTYRTFGPGDIDTECAALNAMTALGTTDGVCYRGKWDQTKFGLSDTTFVAASGDHQYVAFGEGHTTATGRVMLWSSASNRISKVIEQTDLINNASERVLGLALDLHGSLGVARGLQAAYYFDNTLRLQGQFSSGIDATSGGAAFHPLHDGNVANPATRLSYVGAVDPITGTPVIRIVDTFHFNSTGSTGLPVEVPIRDRVLGVLKVSLPLASDNVGLTCPWDASADDRCVVSKLYGLTADNRLAVINVHAKDIRPLMP